MAHDIIQKPQVLSRQEVLIKLWEAREQLEREALDAGDTPASVTPQTESKKAETEVSTSAPQQTSEGEAPAAETKAEEGRSVDTTASEPETISQQQQAPSPETQSVSPQKETHEEVEKAVSEDARAKISSESTPQGGEELSSKEGAPDLMGPEVTAGLKRLLNEWPYFQKSGVLGFGPGGIEHPMFKRIADIPLRNVLNGRWEDPDQELVEEIREYVGGWRREQKVEPKEDDTFEMYLRRVIATILEKRSDIEARTQKG